MEGTVEEEYPATYSTGESLLDHVRFALRYEPLDLRIIYASLEAIGQEALEAWVRDEPTGEFSRRAWFLYETFTGRTLDVESAHRGNYVDALDATLHFVAAPINSPRHRVRDNLLGTRDLCPVIRRTTKLIEMVNGRLAQEAHTLAAHYPPEMLARAANFLYTRETRSSFAIEGESPSASREERFLHALQRSLDFDPSDKEALLELQGTIVEPRYAARDWRDVQNFVGETTRRFGEYVHFICPRPNDVPSLMNGWAAMTARLLTSPVDPVVAAAVSAFSFVFIHPFEDGNGRIHRFVIHSVLAKMGFSPIGIVLPVSAAILRRRLLYDKVLDAFSRPIMPAIDWDFVEENAIVVRNETRDLYRFFDATEQAEYLYSQVAEAIRVDFKEELEFLDVFDSAFTAVRQIVEIPDRRASLLVRLCLQNGGKLARNKRSQFPEITDDEIARMEEAIQSVMGV
jgi:Fic family protein